MKQGWEIKKLGEVCEVIGGGTPSKANNNYYSGSISWATVRDMKGDLITETEHKITEDAVKNSSTNIIPKGNVVIATRVGLGKICLIENDTAINQDLRGIVPKKKSQLEIGFLFQWFKSIAHLIVDEGTGATVQGVKLPFIKNLEIPLPPLPEQQRIVAILDEAFAAIAKAKANAEQNLKNAKELFESYLQGVFEKKGEGWEETSLKKEIDLLVGFAFKSKEYTEFENDILLLRGDNIMQGSLRWEDVKRWKKSEYEDYRKYQLQQGDIVLAMDRPWVKAGLKIARLTKNDLPALLVQRTACLRTKSNLDNSFLFHLLKSKGFMNYLIEVQTGIGVPHISGQQILDFTFYRPSIKDQQTIVQKLDALSTETKKLEAIYQQKIHDLEELKKSILQKAFAGELRTEKEYAL
jgi:type I restriction enzyme S subunit